MTIMTYIYNLYNYIIGYVNLTKMNLATNVLS